MSGFSRLRGELSEDLEDQVERLRHEVSAMRKAISTQGARGYSAGHEQVSELYDEISERLAELMPQVRRHARVAGRAVRDNPAPIIVGAVVVGLLATLLMSRR
jgi:ElaB/YqjD/DUF883 family membrane-anchored ribosome-binding protein